jgi:hypothetical protein
LLEENKLNSIVTSSTKTRSWLEIIISGVAQEIPPLEYVESKYWGAFKNPVTHRNVVYLQPTKKQIRLHMRLLLTFEEALCKRFQRRRNGLKLA